MRVNIWRDKRAVVAAVVAACFVWTSGMTGASAQSPSPSASASPSASPSAPPDTSPHVAFLNPATSYDPGLGSAADPPKVSDLERPYHLLATTSNVSDDAIVEASIKYSGENEIVLGLLDRIGEDAWSMLWDIPDSFDAGAATLVVRLYSETPGGLQEVASDEVEVDMRHQATMLEPDDPAPDETLEILWPTEDGRLGFFKPEVGSWRTAVEFRATPGTTSATVFFSSTPPGLVPEYTQCGTTAVAPGPVNVMCTLPAVVTPSQVTAVAVVSVGAPGPEKSLASQEAADARRVDPYLQDPHTMKILVQPHTRRLAGGCVTVPVRVTDHLDRPVIGAGLDVHAVGPDDGVLFGTLLASTSRAPTNGHEIASGTNCNGGLAGQQGGHKVVGASDVWHRESTVGTGLGGPVNVGLNEWRFALYSATAGFTDLEIWVDDEQIEDEDDARATDSDTIDPDEPVVEAVVQWYPEAPRLSIEPSGTTGPTTTCIPYLVKVRSGEFPVPGANVDLHATGPSDELDFCDVSGGTPLTAPNSGPTAAPGPHVAEEHDESAHADATKPDIQHAEGKSDGTGTMLVGLTSPVEGDTSVIAWMDGEPANDNDIQDGSEASSTGTITWAEGLTRISFLNPSQFGGNGTTGTGNGTQLPDSGGITNVMARVSSPQPVEGVEILVSTDKQTYTHLGDATQIGGTDVWVLPWQIDRPDGAVTLRAKIVGTSITTDIDAKVGAGNQAGVPNAPYESLEITSPTPGQQASFNGSEVMIAGSATAGAEGVELFYTKVPARDTPRAVDWFYCGYVDLDGQGSDDQPFESPCKISSADQAHQVTGLAAITYDCTVDGCDANPFPPPPPSPVPNPGRAPGQKESGAALRIFGLEVAPLFELDPAEDEALIGTCRRFEVSVEDQTGQALRNQNVDLHIPSSDGHSPLCDPGNGTDWLTPTDGAHVEYTDGIVHQGGGEPIVYHYEADTPNSGLLVLGIRVETPQDLAVTSWLDRNDDDLHSGDEPSDTSMLHFITIRDCTIIGTDGDDDLTGTPGPDRICGLGGEDLIQGLEGDDVIYGGGGADAIAGGDGADVLFGGAASDNLAGGAGNDRLVGGSGRDRMSGDDGSDRCQGGPGKDRSSLCEPAGTKKRPARRPASEPRGGSSSTSTDSFYYCVLAERGAQRHPR